MGRPKDLFRRRRLRAACDDCPFVRLSDIFRCLRLRAESPTGRRKDLFRSRRACGDSPIKDVFRRRRLPDVDRLSALPDDLLLPILRRLDTRTALGAAALSKRWAHLSRELPELDLKVTDTLPQRYRRCLLLLREARRSMSLCEPGSRLTDITGRYERRAMRSMVASVENLLASGAHRRVNRLSIEVFAYSTSACINRLIVDAVDSWGVQDLEVDATPTGRIAHPPPVYSFPYGRISRKPGESRLQSLKLANCLPPPLQGFTLLTTLVLQDLPDSTPAAVYEGVVAGCLQLQVLHLVSSCHSKSKTFKLVFDAPMSQIRELVVDDLFMIVALRSLPKLESLTVLHATVLLSSGAAPCLAHVSFLFSVGELEGHTLSFLHHSNLNYIVGMLMRFFEGAMSMTDLALRFTGPGMWIALKNPVCLMANLRRLLIADVTSSLDVSGPHLLIQAAPLLESLHVHVPEPEQETGKEIQWQLSTWRHYHLKELVIIGFQRRERHLRLVKYAVEVSTVLSRVALFKHGHVKDNGPCGWETVSKESLWSNEEKLAVLDDFLCSTPQIEVVLG